MCMYEVVFFISCGKLLYFLEQSISSKKYLSNFKIIMLVYLLINITKSKVSELICLMTDWKTSSWGSIYNFIILIILLFLITVNKNQFTIT